MKFCWCKIWVITMSKRAKFLVSWVYWMRNKGLLLPTFCTFETLLTLITNCALIENLGFRSNTSNETHLTLSKAIEISSQKENILVFEISSFLLYQQIKFISKISDVKLIFNILTIDLLRLADQIDILRLLRLSQLGNRRGG